MSFDSNQNQNQNDDNANANDLFLNQFRSVHDSFSSIANEFGDADVDPGTIVPDQLRRIRGRVLRIRAMTPRLCFATLVATNGGDVDTDIDSESSSICIVLKKP